MATGTLPQKNSFGAILSPLGETRGQTERFPGFSEYGAKAYELSV